MPVDFCDPCSIRPNAVSVRCEQYEVDVGIHASGAMSMGTNQSYSPDFRLRPRPCQDDLEDKIDAATRRRGTLFQRSIWLPLLAASGTGSRSDVIAPRLRLPSP